MGGYIGSLSMVMDATIATIHLILAAEGGGPRKYWIGAFNDQELKKVLDIPPEYDVASLRWVTRKKMKPSRHP
ncbi:hypothetical protein DRO58_07825 [Candidatus Bathyarchaeota archaeon]|nr:MAG: hypothetical protein DRO58_07825 [Candidatus Bathyarchaeota archaeon]